MKKIIGTLIVLLSVFFAGCSSLGVATSGAKYFDGKKKEDLVKYFKYEGESIKSNSEYDEVLYFTNLVRTMYVDKTTVQKFKNKKYSLPLSEFSFKELSDGCLLYENTTHIETEKITQANPDGTDTKIYKENHKNNSSEIKQKIKSFNNAVNQYNAVTKSDEEKMFNKTAVGSEYYVYTIESNSCSYSDEKVGKSTAIYYKYKLQKASVFEDSKSSTESHTAYIFNDRTKSYMDEKGNILSQEQAFATEKSYLEKGFESRKKDKGVALTAYIKDGVVVKTDSAE